MEKNSKTENAVLSEEELALMRIIVANPGRLVFHKSAEWINAFHYGDYMIFLWWREAGVPMEKAIFRLLQIRRGKGVGGTDVFIGRAPDGTCVVFENTSILMVGEEYILDLKEVYLSHDNIDVDDKGKEIGYEWNGDTKVGFIIDR